MSTVYRRDGDQWVVVNSSTVTEVKQIKYFIRGLLLKTVRQSFGATDINIRVATIVEV